MSQLEDAVIRLGERMRGIEFGRRLQEWHPSRRAGDGPFMSLASLELNHGPAIRRTLQALEMSQMAGEDINLSDEDSEYVAWVGRALLAVQRIAGKCWSPIPARIRKLVVDEDDLGPSTSHYVPASRDHQLGPALRFAELDTPKTQALIDDVVSACRNTACHARAVQCAEQIATEADLTERLANRRARVTAAMEFAPELTIGQNMERRRQVVRAAYVGADRDVQEVAAALKDMNELANYVLFSLLGFAEVAETVIVTSDTGAVRCRRKRRLLWGHFATFHPGLGFFGHPPSPFVLRAGLPIDGLYMLEGTTFRWSGRTLVDVHARRLRELEEAGAIVRRGDHNTKR